MSAGLFPLTSVGHVGTIQSFRASDQASSVSDSDFSHFRFSARLIKIFFRQMAPTMVICSWQEAGLGWHGTYPDRVLPFCFTLRAGQKMEQVSCGLLVPLPQLLYLLLSHL